VQLSEPWKGHEQALITSIQKGNKRTEESEEAGYRSQTWTVLRALQQINSATKTEGKAAMAAPPVFQGQSERGSRLDEKIHSSGGNKKDQQW